MTKSGKEKYENAIELLDSNLKGTVYTEDLPKFQEQLTKLADLYQDDEEIGASRYRIYELQALIFFYQENNNEAIEFLNIAIDVNGSSYSYAENLKNQIINEMPMPLELRSEVGNARSWLFLMAVISALTIWGIPCSIIYLILAKKMKEDALLNRRALKLAGAMTILFLIGIIPIFAATTFFSTAKHLQEYAQYGPAQFMSDGAYASQYKRDRVITKVILIVTVSILAAVIAIVAVAANK